MRILALIARIPFRIIIGANILLILVGAAMAASYIYPTAHPVSASHALVPKASNNTDAPAYTAQLATSNTATAPSHPLNTPATVTTTNSSSPVTILLAQPLPTLSSIQLQPQPPVSPATQLTLPASICPETADTTISRCRCSCFDDIASHLCRMDNTSFMCCGAGSGMMIACPLF